MKRYSKELSPEFDCLIYKTSIENVYRKLLDAALAANRRAQTYSVYVNGVYYIAIKPKLVKPKQVKRWKVEQDGNLVTTINHEEKEALAKRFYVSTTTPKKKKKQKPKRRLVKIGTVTIPKPEGGSFSVCLGKVLREAPSSAESFKAVSTINPWTLKVTFYGYKDFK